jgi:hypothetical protein
MAELQLIMDAHRPSILNATSLPHFPRSPPLAFIGGSLGSLANDKGARNDKGVRNDKGARNDKKQNNSGQKRDTQRKQKEAGKTGNIKGKKRMKGRKQRHKQTDKQRKKKVTTTRKRMARLCGRCWCGANPSAFGGEWSEYYSCKAEGITQQCSNRWKLSVR